jgi:hypothetical protein
MITEIWEDNNHNILRIEYPENDYYKVIVTIKIEGKIVSRYFRTTNQYNLFVSENSNYLNQYNHFISKTESNSSDYYTSTMDIILADKNRKEHMQVYGGTLAIVGAVIGGLKGGIPGALVCGMGGGLIGAGLGFADSSEVHGSEAPTTKKQNADGTYSSINLNENGTSYQFYPMPSGGGLTPLYKVDPLIIDLDGNGFNLTTEETGAYFDLDKNGFAESTGWVSGNDIVLAMDRDNNGFIDNGGELFGDQTILKNGQRAVSGVQALAEFDTNLDGKIDANDADFNKLYGIKADGSLISMEEAGISSISLTATDVNQTINENTLARTVEVTKTDGTITQAGDFLLDRDSTDSIATEWVEISDEIATLPEVQGHGNVAWLSQAMQADSTGALKDLVKQFTNEADMGNRDLLLDEIFEKWVGTDNILIDSRGGYNAKKLAVMEAFSGQYFMNDPNSILSFNIIYIHSYKKTA